jgi:hypothetical protein
MVRLGVEFSKADAAQLRDGWRGLVDFGELWAGTERDLWQEEWGPISVGEPLRYGCELRLANDGGVDEPKVRGQLRLWALTELRESMAPGALLTLFDGLAPRARGRVAPAEDVR